MSVSHAPTREEGAGVPWSSLSCGRLPHLRDVARSRILRLEALSLSVYLNLKGSVARASHRYAHAYCVDAVRSRPRIGSHRIASRRRIEGYGETAACTTRAVLSVRQVVRMKRRALLVVVPNPGGPDHDEYESLEDFSFHADKVASGLERMGYEVNTHSETWNWDSETLASRIQGFLEEGDTDDVRLIHVFAHGETKLGGLFPVAADAKTHRHANVDEWLRGVEHDAPQSPSTLFVLDMCGSGVATRTQWGVEVDAEQRRGWVFAAAAPNRAAYNGRLSLAFARMLVLISRGELDVYPGVEWVSWSLARRALLTEMRKLIGDGIDQKLHTTLIEADDQANVRFFPNPSYRQPGPVAQARSDADSGLKEMLDPFDSIDDEHFAGRASGRRTSAHTGAFAGRARQLKNLTDWMNSYTDDAIRVVTGAPGSGKSALLGILVCAAHPQLRARTNTIWGRAVHAPRARTLVAGIHSRGLSAADVIVSISGQLGIPGGEHLAPPSLARAIESLDRPAWVVIDAVDEAQSAVEVVQIANTLADARRPDGKIACYVLVGTRSGRTWNAIQEWIDQIDPLAVVHLDDVSTEELRGDLREYVLRIIGDDQEEFAGALANALTEGRHGSEGWGAFLVAALFCQSLIDRGSASHQGALLESLQSVPTSLPEVLALDLAGAPNGALRRAVLTCLTWTWGAGMPLTVIETLCRNVFAPGSEPGEIRLALSDVLFYAHGTPDTTGETLYRAFHQGLIDVLRGGQDGHFEVKRRIALALLQRPESAGAGRGWAAAESYLLRHATEIAEAGGVLEGLLADEQFLVHGDVLPLLAAFWRLDAAEQETGKVGDPKIRLHRSILAASDLATVPSRRRQVLAADAARYGADDVLHALQRDYAHGQLRVSWATGNGVFPALAATLPPESSEICALLVARLADADYVAVTGTNEGSIRIWSLGTRRMLAELPYAHRTEVVAIANVWWHDVPALVSAGADGVIGTWTLADGIALQQRFDIGYGAIEFMEMVGDEILCVHEQGDVTRTDLYSRRTHVVPLGNDGRYPAGVMIVGMTTMLLDKTPIVVISASDGFIRFHDAHSGVETRDCITGTPDAEQDESGQEKREPKIVQSRALVTFESGSGPSILAGGSDGTTRIWHIRTGALTYTVSGTRAPINAASITVVDGRPIAVASTLLGEIQAWDLETGEKVQELTEPSRTVTALASTGQVGTVVTAGQDHALRVWYLGSRTRVGRPRSLHGGRITGLAASRYLGRSVLVTAGESGQLQVLAEADGSLQAEVKSHTTGTSALATFERDGEQWAVTGGFGGGLRLWISHAMRSVGPTIPAYDQPVIKVWGAARARGGAMLLTSSGTGSVSIWRVDDLEGLMYASAPQDIGDNSGWLHVSDGIPVAAYGPWKPHALRARTLWGTIPRIAASLTTVELGDQLIVWVGGEGGDLSAWDADSMEQLWETNPSQHAVLSLALNRVGIQPVVIAGDARGRLLIMDAMNGEILHSAHRVHDGPFTVKTDPRQVDGVAAIVTGGLDGMIRRWIIDPLVEIDSHAVPGVVDDLIVTDSGVVAAICGDDIIVLAD